MSTSSSGPVAAILRFVAGLRFPWLFALVALVFGVDVLLPDIIPFADELLLGLMTLLLGAWRKRKSERQAIVAGPPPQQAIATEFAEPKRLEPPAGSAQIVRDAESK